MTAPTRFRFRRLVRVVSASALVGAIGSFAHLQFLRADTPLALQLPLEPGIACDGDLIFRRGVGILSDVVLAAAPEPARYSHVGIIRVVNDQTRVIHAVAAEPPPFPAPRCKPT